MDLAVYSSSDLDVYIWNFHGHGAKLTSKTQEP